MSINHLTSIEFLPQMSGTVINVRDVQRQNVQNNIQLTTVGTYILYFSFSLVSTVIKVIRNFSIESPELLVR